jgi:hypothetical protein
MTTLGTAGVFGPFLALIPNPRPRPMLDAGCWMLDAGCWMLDAGCWMLDAGCWMLDAGCWMLDGAGVAPFPRPADHRAHPQITQIDTDAVAWQHRGSRRSAQIHRGDQPPLREASICVPCRECRDEDQFLVFSF